jgi:beta-phosphoglucomutase-like phosphatase (HAD superfamily)
MARIEAVVFDLDGVLVDSEPIWNEVRRRFVGAQGGRWVDGADRRMMGMATADWARYLHDDLGVDLPEPEIADRVVDAMAARYVDAVPLLPGAAEAVERVARRWPLGLASAGLAASFRVTVSTEEVGPGKPAPDVYLAAARRLGTDPERCAAVEDSTNGLRSARAAGLRVVAVPTRSYPPDPAELARADAVIGSLDELTDGVIDPGLG